MGWKESNRVSERLELCRLYEGGSLSMAELCRRFGVSRKTGYKWVKRWSEGGEAALSDRSRRPKNSPNQASDQVESEAVSLRRQHPRWGGRKIAKLLEGQDVSDVPSASTITRILHRHGLIAGEESEKRKAWTRFEMDSPNDLWQIDFKGNVALASGGRCHPLTILDDCSRYSLGIVACANESGSTVKPHFRQVFQKYGIPRAIYVDNGNPWGTSQNRTRHTRFSAWLMRQDIEVIHGRPYHPQGRGKIERFHRTLKLEVLQDRQLQNLEDAQSAFDPWRTCYNHQRPHEALDMKVPASIYHASVRRFEEVTDPFEYSSGFQTRRPNKTGQFPFESVQYRISDAFTDHPIGLRPTTTDGIWDIYYCRFAVAQLNQRTGQITYDRRLAEARYARFSQSADGGS